jgi:hypothetical protein
MRLDISGLRGRLRAYRETLVDMIAVAPFSQLKDIT